MVVVSGAPLCSRSSSRCGCRPLKVFDTKLPSAPLGAERHTDASFVCLGNAAFAAIFSDSIDHSFMERCPSSRIATCMVELDAVYRGLGACGSVLIADSRKPLALAMSRLVALVDVRR